jgi:5'-methylthioadenosine phosphorylase
MAQAVLGIIGGSGFYDVALDNARTEKIDSPWGAPSEALRLGEMGGLPVAFLPRHGRGHPLSPSDINYRANIDVLKRAGVTDLVSISACGSFREELPPGTFVIVDQFIDRTFARPKSFFGPGCVAHVSLAEPVSPRLADWSRRRPRPKPSAITAAAPTSPWRARSSPPWPNRSSTAPGAATSSA